MPETGSQQFVKNTEKIGAGKTEKEKDEDLEKLIEEHGEELDAEDESDMGWTPKVGPQLGSGHAIAPTAVGDENHLFITSKCWRVRQGTLGSSGHSQAARKL